MLYPYAGSASLGVGKKGRAVGVPNGRRFGGTRAHAAPGTAGHACLRERTEKTRQKPLFPRITLFPPFPCCRERVSPKYYSKLAKSEATSLQRIGCRYAGILPIFASGLQGFPANVRLFVTFSGRAGCKGEGGMSKNQMLREAVPWMARAGRI